MRKKNRPRAKHILIAATALLISASAVTAARWYLRPTPHPLVAQLTSTQKEREASFKKGYRAKNIPDPIATLTSRIDCIEEDIAALSAALKQAPPESQAALQSALTQRDAEVHTILKNAGPLLEKYEEKAIRAKAFDLLKIINVLQSRSFLFERAKDGGYTQGL